MSSRISELTNEELQSEINRLTPISEHNLIAEYIIYLYKQELANRAADHE